MNDDSMILPRNKKLSIRAKEMRSNPTDQEARLWYNCLRSYPLHFYRQRIIGSYIVDFYCPMAKLVIEVDGVQHNEPDAVEYDNLRTLYLNSLGLDVVRFSNDDITYNLPYVSKMIAAAVAAAKNR